MRPGKTRMKTGRILSAAQKKRALACVGHAGGAQGLLHDDLVGAPVPDAQDDGAEDRAGPGIHGVAGRLHHVEELGWERRTEAGEAPDLLQPDQREQRRTGDEDERLDEIRVDHRRQSPRDRVDAGGRHEQHGGGEVVPAEHFTDENAAREERHRDLGEDVGEERDPREVPPRAAAEAPLQEFGHRVDAAGEVVRHEEPGQQEQADARGPFVGAHRQAGGGARAGQADEVLAADVGGEDRRPDGEPADVLAGEKVVARRPAVSREVEADREDHDEVKDQDGVVDHVRGPPLAHAQEQVDGELVEPFVWKAHRGQARPVERARFQHRGVDGLGGGDRGADLADERGESQGPRSTARPCPSGSGRCACTRARSP